MKNLDDRGLISYILYTNNKKDMSYLNEEDRKVLEKFFKSERKYFSDAGESFQEQYDALFDLYYNNECWQKQRWIYYTTNEKEKAVIEKVKNKGNSLKWILREEYQSFFDKNIDTMKLVKIWKNNHELVFPDIYIEAMILQAMNNKNFKETVYELSRERCLDEKESNFVAVLIYIKDNIVNHKVKPIDYAYNSYYTKLFELGLEQKNRIKACAEESLRKNNMKDILGVCGDGTDWLAKYSLVEEETDED